MILPRFARNPSRPPPGMLLQASSLCRYREILIFIPLLGWNQGGLTFAVNGRCLLSVTMTLPCWACDAGLGLARCWVSSGALCKIPSFFTFRWVCSAPSSGRSTEIPRPSLSLATKPWLRGREGIFARAPPVHPSPGKCRRQTAGFILVPANHKLICLLMQLLPVHVFPNEEHQNANLSSGVHQPPELTAVTRLEAVLLTSASCALSLALIFLLSGHFFPTDLFFSLPLNCSPAQFSMK